MYLKSKAFSIPELMVAITVGLILITLLFNSFTTSTHSSQEDMQNVRLNNSLYSALNQITSEIARAGSYAVATTSNYATNYSVQITPTTNSMVSSTAASFPAVTPPEAGPVLITDDLEVNGDTYLAGMMRLDNFDGIGTNATGTVLQIFTRSPVIVGSSFTLEPGQWRWVSPFVIGDDATNKLQIQTINGSPSCILFTYDKDSNDLISQSDQFGFRLYDNNGIGVIQFRNGGTPFDCSDNTAWQNITDANDIDVTNLQFIEIPTTFTGEDGRTMTYHSIQIDLSAHLIGNDDVSFTRSQTIMVRNASVTLQ